MPGKILIDAGPIVSYLTDDAHHDWAAEQFSRFDSFETCEAALSEACARLTYAGFDQTAVIRLVVTLDKKDFSVYRRYGWQAVPVLAP